MLVVANIPIFVIFFFGVFAYLVVKMLSSGSKSETREIFEFYLSANEILRNDDRRWFGFEISETIRRGEGLVQRMSVVPPLVSFTLGALYNKAGDHKAAVNYLSGVLEKESSDERAFMYPTPELRSYVKVLRKIEREPADAPLTSAAVRALERTRRLRGRVLLEESRTKFANGVPSPSNQYILDTPPPAPEDDERMPVFVTEENGLGQEPDRTLDPTINGTRSSENRTRSRKTRTERFSERKPISEVLHDIYDKNVQ